jgi:hypothetical protein
MTTLDPVSLPARPRSIEEFVARRDQVATTPQGGAAMMVVALLLCAQDETLGGPCLAAAVAAERLAEGGGGYQGWRLRRSDLQLIHQQLAEQPYLPNAYFKGTSPESGYALPEPPYLLEFTANPHSGDPAEGRFKVFVACSGAATPRPITVRRNALGIWQAYEWSSLIVGIARPV